MYAPESVASMLSRSDVVVIAAINGIHYSAGDPVPPPLGPNGEPPRPGTLLPQQPDQIVGLTVLHVLSGTLPDGPLTIYKVNERFWISPAEIGQRWLFFLSRQSSGRWRTVVTFTPDAVDEVRVELAALAPQEAEAPVRPARTRTRSEPPASAVAADEPTNPEQQAPEAKPGRLAALRRTFGLD
jgi:hypothetical protein